MKIGMLGAWNTSSGASIHAELVGRAWVELGHKLTVFTFYPHSYHGASLTSKDEDYVQRCFTTSRHPEVRLDPVPILTSAYDYFVIQDHGMIPNDLLGKIFPRIKKRSKTVAVIHDGKLSDDPSFYQFEWDAIVAFDERYENFLRRGYPGDKIVRIPYPSLPLKRGDMRDARKRLNLPLGKKIAFMFGPAASYGKWVLEALKKNKYPADRFILLVVTKDKKALRIFRRAKGERFTIELREEAPYTDRLYEYLYASDVLIFHKESKPHAVVSSTIHQCLGSGCPILAYTSNFTGYFGPEVIKYKDSGEFKTLLGDILKRGQAYKKSQEALERFLRKNDDTQIARKFIRLFKTL